MKAYCRMVSFFNIAIGRICRKDVRYILSRQVLSALADMAACGAVSRDSREGYGKAAEKNKRSKAALRTPQKLLF